MIRVYIYTTSQKYLATPKNSSQKCYFLWNKLSTIMFIYHTIYKSSSFTLTLEEPDIFWKIDLKAFFFFSTEHELNVFQNVHYTTTWTHIRIAYYNITVSEFSRGWITFV